MATAQMTRPAKTQSQSIVPDKIETVQESLLFVKRLLAVAISNITYLRGIFPEFAFSVRYLDDLSLKVINEVKSFPGTSQITEWIKGCFDAIEKNYLRMLVLAVYLNPNDANTIFESYTFKFTYTELGPKLNVCSNKNKFGFTVEDTKHSTRMLIRKLFVLMENLEEMPQDVSLTMKLFYYDEVTPPDYQPPGFKQSSTDTLNFVGDPLTLRVGHVATAYHSLRVRITVDRNQLPEYSDEVVKTAAEKRAADDHPSQLECNEMERAESQAQLVPQIKTPEWLKNTVTSTPDPNGREGSSKANPRNAVGGEGGEDGENKGNTNEDGPLLDKTAELCLDNQSKIRSGLSVINRKQNHVTNPRKTLGKKRTPKMSDLSRLQEPGASQDVRRNPPRAARMKDWFKRENDCSLSMLCSQGEEPPRKLSRNSEPNEPVQARRIF